VTNCITKIDHFVGSKLFVRVNNLPTRSKHKF